LQGHIKLSYTDLNENAQEINLVLSRLREGFESIELYEVTKEGINTYLQHGCTLLKGNILRYVYDDFSGGDMQETFSLQTVGYKTKNTTIKPQTGINSSKLIYFNTVNDNIPPGDSNDYVIEKVLVVIENTISHRYILLRHKDGTSQLYKDRDPVYINNVLTIFIKNNVVHIIYESSNEYYDFYSDTHNVINWTHSPIKAEYSEPYLYTADASGTIRIFSVSLLSGYLPIRLDLIENGVCHIDKKYSILPKVTGNFETKQAPARIGQTLSVLESEGANYLIFKSYNNNRVTKTDTLIVECIAKEAGILDPIIRGYYNDNKKAMTRVSTDAFGYDSMLNSGQCEGYFHKRLAAKPTTGIQDDDLIIGIGTYEEGETPVIDDEDWIDNIAEVEVPLRPIFKIYWASNDEEFFYYQFFLGEEIDIGIRATIDIPEGLAIIKIANKLPRTTGFSVGDKWMLPMYAANEFSDGQIQLPEKVISGSVAITNAPTIINNANYYYSSVSQTHRLPIIRTLQRKLIDKHDLSFSFPNTRLVINRPEYGGRIGSDTTITYSYVEYDFETELTLIPGELSNKHIIFNENIADYPISPEDEIVILSNSENHLNLRVQPKSQNPLTNFPGPNATIIQRDDDILFDKVINGTITTMTELEGQIFICSYDGIDSYLYIVNRTGLKLVETIFNEKAYGSIIYQNTLVYTAFTDDKIKVYILGGEVIYEEPAEESFVSFQRIEDVIYITHKGGIICVQPQTTNNFYSPYCNYGVSGILDNEVVLNHLIPVSGTIKKGLLQTSFNSFGKDGATNKKLMDVNVQYVNGITETVKYYKDHSDTEINLYDMFKNLSIEIEAEADAIESITIDFKPEFESSRQFIFTVSVNPNVRDLDQNLIDPTLTHQVVIDNLIAMPTNTEYILTDLDEEEHIVNLEKIQVKGNPSLRSSESARDNNSYIATFYFRELN